MLRDASLSDSSMSDHCSFSSLVIQGLNALKYIVMYDLNALKYIVMYD